MDKKFSVSLWQVGVGVALLVAAIGVGVRWSANTVPSGENPPTNNESQAPVVVSDVPSAPSSTVPSPAGSGSGSGASSPVVKSPVRSAGLSFITPQKGETWAMNKSHVIAWNKPAGVAGGIYVVDVQTKKTVGWILPVTTSRQSSFMWDTRDVSVTRTGGTRQALTPGMYTIRLMFDGKYAEIETPPITLVPEGGAEFVSALVRIGEEKIVPAVLNVARGQKVVFLNADTVAHTISKIGAPDFTVLPNSTFVLDTGTMTAGTYIYSSNVYTYRAPGTLIIK